MNYDAFPLFAGLDDSERAFLSDCLTEKSFAEGDCIVSRDVANEELFFITEGTMRVHYSRGKADHELATPSAPCIIGELEFFCEESKPFEVTATSPVEAMSISYDAFRRHMVDGQVAILKVVANVARVLARRLSSTDEKIIGMIEAGNAGPAHKDLEDLKAKLFTWSV